MEKVVFVSRKHGRKPRHGTVGMIGGTCFAIIPVRTSRTVFFGIPGAGEDFLEVHAEPWSGKDDVLDSLVATASASIAKLDPQTWVDFSARALEEVRAKQATAHRDYLLALLAEHRAFKGKDWK